MQGSKKSLESRTGLEEIASCAIISSTPDPQVTAVSRMHLLVSIDPEKCKYYIFAVTKKEL